MLKALSDLLDKTLRSKEAGDDATSEHALNLATALLLVEVSRADYSEDLAEAHVIEDLLRQNFSLADDEIALLIAEAREEADHAASLQQFTRTLHEQLSVAEKHRIVEMLWRVALADHHLDKHEDHLIRRIAGLLYVSHTDLIRLRNSVYARYN